jgi:hypothetical protein
VRSAAALAELLKRLIVISGVFGAAGTISATQRSSENNEAAESLCTPLLVVVHAPFAAAIAYSAQVVAVG